MWLYFIGTYTVFVFSFILCHLVILLFFFFFFNDTATTEIYTLSLHDALPILPDCAGRKFWRSAFSGSRSTSTGQHLVLSFFRARFSRWWAMQNRGRRWPLCWFPARSSHFSPTRSSACSATAREAGWRCRGGGGPISSSAPLSMWAA